MKIISILFFIPLFATAGDGWVGSGGELFKDAHNPWFVKNTKEVQYCVSIDRKSISVSEDQIQNKIKEAIKYWKKELSKTQGNKTPGYFSMGQQNFVKTECTNNPDIKFKFGYKSLTQEEIDFLQKPERYIGISVRTNYDRKNLKGKGFVYISSDIGPKSYENNGQLVTKAWSKPKLLLFTLIHEIGHVIGIPHIGNGLMGQNFLNQLLNKFLVDSFTRLPIESFIRPDNQFQVCEINRRIKTFVFNLTPTEDCLDILLNKDKNTYTLFAMENGERTRKVGEILNLKAEISDIKSLPISTLYIEKKQNVFNTNETLFRNFMFGPLMQDQGYKAVLLLKEGNLPYKVYIRVRPNSFALYGTYKKATIPFFIKQSPLALLLMKQPTP
jgi:hypothetical protein